MELSNSPAESSAPSLTAFPFLSLPTEIRLLIYNHVFTGVSQRLSHPEKNQEPSQAIMLLLTCRSILDEAAAVLYGMISFHANNGFDLTPYVDRPTQFLTQIGTKNQGYLRSLVLDWSRNLDLWNLDVLSENGDVMPAVKDVWARGPSPIPYPPSKKEEEFQAAYEWRICRTLGMLAVGCPHLDTLEVTLPGRKAFTLAGELGYMSNFFERRDVREALGRTRVRSKFSVGFTKDYVTVEEIAREMGVRKVKMFWVAGDCMLDNGWLRSTELMLKDQMEMKERGWDCPEIPMWFGGYAEKALVQEY